LATRERGPGRGEKTGGKRESALVGEERGGEGDIIGRGESVRGRGCFGELWSTMREGQWQTHL